MRTFDKLDAFEADLEKMMPNPGKVRLIDINKEYSPTELQDMLQHFGSYLATLHWNVAMIEAQTHALKESLKTGLQVRVVGADPKLTVSAREAEVLAGDELLRDTRRLQIDNESVLILAKGWLSAYEAAYAAISRIVSLTIGEASLQTGRHA